MIEIQQCTNVHWYKTICSKFLRSYWLQWRDAANITFKEELLRKVLNDFNNECDKIRDSKKIISNYKKVFVDKMELTSSGPALVAFPAYLHV